MRTRFYVIIGGLLLVLLCTLDLASQSRQTVYEQMWSIGTNNPKATLHVNGNAYFFDGGTSSNGLRIGDAGMWQNVGSGVNGQLSVGRNVYYDAGTYRRMLDDNEASLLQFGANGGLTLYRATDVGNTAGSAITFSVSLMSSNSGRLYVNGDLMSLGINSHDIGDSVNHFNDLFLGGVALVGPGSLAAPSIGWAADADGSGTGFYRSAPNQVSTVINGTTEFAVDGSAVFVTDGLFRMGSSFSTYIDGSIVNVVQLGIDSSAASAQLFKGPDGSGANTAGGGLRLAGGTGIGNTNGGFLALSTSLSSNAPGSSIQPTQDRLYLWPKDVILTEASATTIVTITNIAAGQYVGIRLLATTHADDATDFQAITETVAISAVNKAGTMTLTVSAPSPSATALSSGTLTSTWTAVQNGSSVDIKNSAVSSLTQTTLNTKWRVEVDSDAPFAVLPVLR